ncbi:hypothetical protein GOV04_02255 [Candidatus Woesearchaeota archaeon]|nr:hypothetical protein [Candidatus Woesearchaeota archaeon]
MGGYVQYNNPIDGTTRQYPKDEAGNTNESTSQTIHHESGNVTDSRGDIVGNVKDK